MYDSITNRGEYFSNHYLASLLPESLKKNQWKHWAAEEKERTRNRQALPEEKRGELRLEELTPRERLRRARPAYQAARLRVRELEGSEAEQRSKEISEWHAHLLEYLGFSPEPQTISVPRADNDFDVPVAHVDGELADGLVAIECGFANNLDDAFDEMGDGLLLEPVEASDGVIETGDRLITWLFTCDERPRYVLMLAGGVVIVADRTAWGEGRYLAVDLDIALERNDTKNGGELDYIAGLFSAEMLRKPESETSDPLAQLREESGRHAVGVSKNLRDGLRISVELVANEVLSRMRNAGVTRGDLGYDSDQEFANRLTKEALRYLYRIVFLLYAEARPDTGILPVSTSEYMQGYSLARLGDLVVPELDSTAEEGFHFYESLDALFRRVNDGYQYDVPVGDSEGPGIRFEALRAELFDPKAIELMGKKVSFNDVETVDTRLRNRTLHKVLQLLMLTRGGGQKRGRGRSSTEPTSKQGGFISYAQLGINQLGAVYEGLMSYTGRIAAGEPLLEVAKGGDSKDGSWLVPESRADDFDEDVFVKRNDPYTDEPKRVRYLPGEFVYRLAGRDRQTSASYYTPESLTHATVKLALDYRLKEAEGDVSAEEMLNWKICEPALGSGAFLNEAINQLAAMYLRKRQEELQTELPAEEYQHELQKVKAYIALHNCYGVDLNETAVELAEVSLWLNVMHPGMQAPWFGLHLRQGNSLIGANRRYYTAKQVRSKDWLGAAPEDLRFRDRKPLPDGAVHHFLLPADGWGSVAGEKEAKNLAPEETDRLRKWRNAMRLKPSAKQVKRLQKLARQVEFLWSLVIKRLEISERESARQIDVWGRDSQSETIDSKSKEQILDSLGALKDDLEDTSTPYGRLKSLMDAWCAMWFWNPLDIDELTSKGLEESEGDEDQPTLFTPGVNPGAGPIQGKGHKLETLEDWIAYAEALVGTAEVTDDTIIPKFENLEQLSEYEDELPDWTGMEDFFRLQERFPWRKTVRRIADDQRFFHWELHYAHVFDQGGFDIQVGNPPWVRPRWDEKLVLAELDPWFALVNKPSTANWRRQKENNLQSRKDKDFFLGELASLIGLSSFLGNTATYHLISGTQPDLYRAFMDRLWRNLAHDGTGGLIHPGTHLSGKKELNLRRAAYQHLRLHCHFRNARKLFEDVHHEVEYGIHVYGSQSDPEFLNLGWIYDPATAIDSLDLFSRGETVAREFAPAQKHEGKWDTRAHPGRVVQVNAEVLKSWKTLSGDDSQWQETKLLFPVSGAEQAAIDAVARHPQRTHQFQPQITRGFDEKGAKEKGLIKWDTSEDVAWDDVVLQGSFFNISTPYGRYPNVPCRHNNDFTTWDLTDLVADPSLRTNYVRACSEEDFEKAKTKWVDYENDNEVRPYTDFYRLAWRRMIPLSTERSLFPAIIPPGPAHIDGIMSAKVGGQRLSALTTGFWSGIPLDYFVRISGIVNLLEGVARTFPAPDPDHVLASELLYRTLRLNCLTEAYAPLWSDLYETAWTDETWAIEWPQLSALGLNHAEWQWETPLRSEYERRAALVEIDAIVAVMLNMSADQLVAIYLSRYPVLSDREEQTWFDANGRKLCGDTKAGGLGQTKEHFEQLQEHLEHGGPVPEGYAAPFYKADRVREMTEAHAEFTRRLEERS